MKIFKSFGIIALAVIIGFAMIACKDKDDKDDDDPIVEVKPLFSVSGQFPSAQSGNAKFKAETAETVSRAAGTTYDLSGELEDGDLLLKLTGSFDPADNSYTVSAAASFLRYTVIGNSGGATATVAVKDSGGNRTSHIVSVTITEVTIKDGEAQEETGGLPSWALGNWEDKWSINRDDDTENAFESYAYFTPWYYEQYENKWYEGYWDGATQKYTVIDVEAVNDDKGAYDVVFAYPRYTPTKEQLIDAAEQFLTSIGQKNNFEFFPYGIAPWESQYFFNDEEREQGKHNDTVVWYICKDPDHGDKFGNIHWVNWFVFLDQLDQAGLIEEYDTNGDPVMPDVWRALYSFMDDVDKFNDPIGDWYWGFKDHVEKLFESYNINQKYYWGWFTPGWEDEDHFDRDYYTCWAPAEDSETFWQTQHYFIRWVEAGQIGFHTVGDNDWDALGLTKWWTEDYLNKYLVSKNVSPETWYTKVRIWQDEDGQFVFKYYNGRNDSNGHHSAPPCDSKDYNYVKGLTFDSYDLNTGFYGWSKFYLRDRPNFRYNY